MDYWKIGKDNAIISFPLEKRLGFSEGTFENSAEGFKNFTEQTERIEAIVEVYRVIDEYSIYVKSNISNRKILIDFESKVSYDKGDMIYIEGGLKIDDFKVIKNSEKE